MRVWHQYNTYSGFGYCPFEGCGIDSLVICALVVLGLGVIGPCFDMHYLVSFQLCDHLAKEERAGCFINCLLAVECI